MENPETAALPAPGFEQTTL